MVGDPGPTPAHAPGSEKFRLQFCVEIFGCDENSLAESFCLARLGKRISKRKSNVQIFFTFSVPGNHFPGCRMRSPPRPPPPSIIFDVADQPLFQSPGRL